MREIRKIQLTLTEPWLELPHAKELKAISDLFEHHPMVGALVAQDSSRGKARRCVSFTGDQVLHAMIVKQMNGFSYDELEWYLPLAQRVLCQTRRRVFDGEIGPASEKLISIFEEHTDIVVKASRETQFGHEVTLTGGASPLILDCVIAEGKLADSSEAEAMIDRQKEIYGRPPQQASFNGGYTSRANLDNIKGKGVQDVVFHKKRGLEISEMGKSAWVFRKLKVFRAGIEVCISVLRRIFGLDRCAWRSLASFECCVWASVVSFNLLVMAICLIK